MVKFVGQEKMTPVQLALETARFELACLHGSTVIGTVEPSYRKVINNSEALNRIDEALKAIQKCID